MTVEQQKYDVEIVCPDGVGLGTTVQVNGQPLEHVAHLHFEISARGYAILTVDTLFSLEGKMRIIKNSEGNLVIPLRRFVFKGGFEAVEVTDDWERRSPT